jgi:hypothetical protein
VTSPRQILIDWDWGASGIWWVLTPEELAAPPPPGGQWLPASTGPDRHQAWRGKLSDDLIDALQAWNARGEEVMGGTHHLYSDADRAAFWARGRDLAGEVQQQLGPGYEVDCRAPTRYSP